MRMRTHLMLAVVALGTGTLFAAEVEVKARADTDSPRVETEVRRDGDRPRADFKQEARIESSVLPINKARSILGMEVRNRNDEKLGEVKDIVLDLQTGKVSYLALAIGGFLGVGEKLVAVPAGALATSERNPEILIMDATRGEMVDAPGFAATNWPDHRNPNFNDKTFWRPKSRGNAPAGEKGRIYTDADSSSVEARTEVRTSRDRDVRVDASTERNNSVSRTTTGRIRTINNNIVILDAGNGRTETFALPGKNVRASDYKVGDQVTVRYHHENGKMVIDDLGRR